MKIFLLGFLLAEAALAIAFFFVGSGVYTPTEGEFDRELLFGPPESIPVRRLEHGSPAVDLGRGTPPGSLVIRYATTNGRIYQLLGDAHLLAADGTRLWSEQFEGFTWDLGPPVFALTFADLDGDGRVEACFRQAMTEYSHASAEAEASVRRDVGPLEVAWIRGKTREIRDLGWRGRFMAHLVETRLAFSLLGPIKASGLLFLLVVQVLALLAGLARG